MGYTTRFDWRPEVEQVKIYVDNYLVDSADRQSRGAGSVAWRDRSGGRPRWRRRARRRSPNRGDADGARRLADHRRDDGDRVRRPHDAVRGGRPARAHQAGDRGGAQDRAEQAGDPGDRVTPSFRSHVGSARGGRRRADGHFAPRQRRHLPRDDVAAGAELPRRSREQRQRR